MELNNNYFVLRHGGALSNKENFYSCWPEKRKNSLTEEGRKQIENIIPQLREAKINLIFSSDLLRTEETAQIVAEGLGLDVNFDDRLREYDVGFLNNQPLDGFYNFFKDRKEMFSKRLPGGENKRDIKERLSNFLEEIDKEYKNKNILVISHGEPLFIFESIIKEMPEEEMLEKEKELKLNTGEFKKISPAA